MVGLSQRQWEGSDGETVVRELDTREAEGVKFFQGWELEMFVSVNRTRCQRPAMQTYLVGDKQKLARGL
jgi:hypothetical protein